MSAQHLPDKESTFAPELLAQRQLELLQASLNRAHKMVPFYRERFLENGAAPQDVEKLEDLARLPFVRREDLAAHYPYGMFAVPLRDIVRIHTASGAGNKPSVTGYTKNDLALWETLVGRALKAAGVNDQDIVQIHLDPGLANWGRDYKDGAEALEASVIPLTPLSLQKQLMVLSDYRTTVLVTTPVSAGELLESLARSGAAPGNLALKNLILVGEPTDAKLREQIEKELSLTTWLHWGLHEVPGPAIAFECEAHNGLHVSEDHFYLEIVDPDTGKPAKDEGEIVLTTLSTRAFPLIRFRTGDRARITSAPCPCGRTLKRIHWLSGRTDGMALIRGVKVHPSQVLAIVESILGFVPLSCKLFTPSKEAGQGLEVRLGMDDRLFSDEVKELEKIMASVETGLRQELGVPVCVRLMEQSADVCQNQALIKEPL
jgi:phenylacetate-CoA ligase